MRLFLPLLAPLMIASTVPAAPPPSRHGVTPVPTPVQQPHKVGKNCGGKVEAVREERGLPLLRRENSQRGDALMILAVDKQIDGCEVLVMAYDANDVRPLPDYADGPPQLRNLH